MISIIHDVPSKKDKKDPKCEYGWWGAKADRTEVEDMAMLKQIMAMKEYIGIHEVLTGDAFKPFADYDKKYKSKEDYDANVLSDLDMARDTMIDLFPGGEVHMYVSNGFDPKKQVWKGSAHFTVTKYGYYPLAKDVWQRIQTCDWKEIGFDDQVYNTNHFLRLPYCKKPEDNRVLKRAEFTDDGDLKYFEIDFKTLADGLVTVPSGPKLASIYVEPKKPRKQRDGDEDEESDEEEDEDWSSWTYEKAKAVIQRLADDRSDTHGKRIDGLFSIVHLGRALKKMRKFRDLGHLFAMKDPKYDKDKTDEDWDYCKGKKSPNPRTFASIIKFANEDNPVAQEIKLHELDEIPLTNFDEKHKLLENKPKLADVQKWMMGCIRHCNRKGALLWYQHSTDGWYLIQNSKNMPFSCGSTNSKFQNTDFADIFSELKDTMAFYKHCMIDGTEFYPFYDEPEPPNIINTFRGYPFKSSGKSDLTDNARFFRDYILGLFGPTSGEYVLNTLTKKLRFPRLRGAFIIGFGRFGGEGKNATEALIKPLFGLQHTLSCIGTANILGQGDAKYNPLVEDKLIIFSQEARADGKSIVDEDAFKSWLSEDTQVLRKMKENPRIIANLAICFMWTNNANCAKMTGPMARRTLAERVSDQYIDNKELFDRAWRIAKDSAAMQEIFDWMINRNIDNFIPEDIPDTQFKNEMKECSMTPVQRYIVDVCNGDRNGIDADEKGNVLCTKEEMYKDFRKFCADEGMTKVTLANNFVAELKNMDIVVKQSRYPGSESRPICVKIDGPELEKIMRKFLKNKDWVLLYPKDEDENDE